MIDSERENYSLTINLNGVAMELLQNYQQKLELLFDKKFSYEEIFINSLFFNNIKLAIDDHNDHHTKKVANQFQKNRNFPSDPIPRKHKKRVIPYKEKPEQQARLGGF
jgi:hypothetical protein